MKISGILVANVLENMFAVLLSFATSKIDLLCCHTRLRSCHCYLFYDSDNSKNVNGLSTNHY